MKKLRIGLSVAALIALAFVSVPRADQAQAPGRGAGRGVRQGRGGERPQRQRARKVVLAWADTRNGQAQHESVSHALSVIERIGYESGAHDTLIRNHSNTLPQQPPRAP